MRQNVNHYYGGGNMIDYTHKHCLSDEPQVAYVYDVCDLYVHDVGPSSVMSNYKYLVLTHFMTDTFSLNQSPPEC